MSSFPGAKRPGREVDHSFSSSAEVKNEWSYTPAPSMCFHCVDRGNFAFTPVRGRWLQNNFVITLLLCCQCFVSSINALTVFAESMWNLDAYFQYHCREVDIDFFLCWYLYRGVQRCVSGRQASLEPQITGAVTCPRRLYLDNTHNTYNQMTHLTLIKTTVLP